MPSIYAHNKFGKKVLKDMPENLRILIRKYPDSFRIGLQGPDSLFFYIPFYKNKTNQTGVAIHKRDAYGFFEQALCIINAKGLDTAYHAYLLGFICHFSLDYTCHPYVTEAMIETNCGHIEIEGDFDHYLLQKDGKIPHQYRMDKLVPTDLSTALSVAAFYPEISFVKVYKALRHMKYVKRFFVSPSRIKQYIIDIFMRATLHYKHFKGHLQYTHPNKNCRHCSEHLYKILLQSVPKANSLINDFESSLLLGIPLSDEFHQDFSGNKFEKE